MITTRSHSFCWGFCLSFACLLVWFVPLEALFAGPMPSPSYEEEEQSLVAQVAPQVPKNLRVDYRTVFGGSLMSGPWAKKSAMGWDGLSPHPLVSLDGPCIYFPISEQDVTDDVEADQPINGLRFISTIGWVNTTNGNFPVSFLASSNGKETLFYFTGLLPAEFFAVVDSESNDELGNLRDLSPCPEGVAVLKACDAQLDGVLSVEVSQSSQTLRHMLGAMNAEKDICQLSYENAVRGAAALRKIALAAARATRDTALDAAVVTLAVCIAAAHAALAGCLLLAAGTTWWSLGVLTVLAAAVCASLFLLAEAACLAILVTQNNAAKNAYDIAVAAANAAYDATVLTAQNARRICLSQVNTERVAMACVHIPQLGPASTAALESHRACYTEVTAFNLDCFESSGVIEQLDHAFHQALDECGTGEE
jgi:hypothetical protein